MAASSRAPVVSTRKRKFEEDERQTIPNVLQGEVARLDPKFLVNLDPSHCSNSGAVHLICKLGERRAGLAGRLLAQPRPPGICPLSSGPTRESRRTCLGAGPEPACSHPCPHPGHGSLFPPVQLQLRVSEETGSAGVSAWAPHWPLQGLQAWWALPGHRCPRVLQMTRISPACRRWSSACLPTTPPRARCGSIGSGSTVGDRGAGTRRSSTSPRPRALFLGGRSRWPRRPTGRGVSLPTTPLQC